VASSFLIGLANSTGLGNSVFPPLAPWAWLPYSLALLGGLVGLAGLWLGWRHQRRYGLILVALGCLPLYPIAYLREYGWPLTPRQAAARKKARVLQAPVWPHRNWSDRVDYYDPALAPFLLADQAYTRQLAAKLTQSWTKEIGSLGGRPAQSYEIEHFGQLAAALYLARRYQGQTPAQALADEAGSRALLLLGNTNAKGWLWDDPRNQPWLRDRLGLKEGKYPIEQYADYQLISPVLWATEMIRLAERPALLDTLACHWLLDELTRTPLRVSPDAFATLANHLLTLNPLEKPQTVRALVGLRNQVHNLAPSLARGDTLPVDFVAPGQRKYFSTLQPWLISTGWVPRLDSSARPKLVIDLRLDSTFTGSGLEPVYQSVTRSKQVTKSRQVPQTRYGRRGHRYKTYRTETYYETQTYTDLEKTGEQMVNYYDWRLKLRVGSSPQALSPSLVMDQYLKSAGLPSYPRSWLYGLRPDWH
jgi:hypothetical protein